MTSQSGASSCAFTTFQPAFFDAIRSLPPGAKALCFGFSGILSLFRHPLVEHIKHSHTYMDIYTLQ